MDNNNFQENNNQGGFSLNSDTTEQNTGYAAPNNQGYDPQTFNTTTTGSYNSTVPPTFVESS